VATTPQTPAVARARFATFVERALDNARAGGLTDREIQRRSGVATSTFHRWRLAEGKGLPKLPAGARLLRDGRRLSVEEAMRVLGMTDSAPEPTPEPPLPRDVRIILRRLADPNTPNASGTSSASPWRCSPSGPPSSCAGTSAATPSDRRQ
jgi:hypothetical protein